jgi:transcriptional regulator NrdR family protein
VSEETKQVWDNLFQKLNEKEKIFLAVVNNEKNKEIERQKEVINGMIENEEKYNLEIIKLKSIIKEVREYIEENTNSDSFTVLTSGKITDIPYCIVAFEDILEILDKENKNGER